MNFKLLIIFLTAFSLNGVAQSWTSIPKGNYFSATPFSQFTISPYSNALWAVGYNNVATITQDGVFTNYTSSDLGPISINQKQQFIFTSNDIFYIRDSYGLYTFNNGVSVSTYPNFTDYKGISSNLDTMYIVLNTPNFTKKYINGMVTDIFQTAPLVLAKDTFYYFSDGQSYVGYNVNGNTSNSVLLSFNDHDFLQGLFYDVKYTRRTDSLYVGGKKGISMAYNYDFIDTITPNNTTNMPSSHVLEMEWDLNDSLWAIFGDANENAIALAKLEGSTWTNIYNSNNCPIDFSTFIGMQIDTLGTIFLADANAIHALTNPNSPAWLKNLELPKVLELMLSPNPVSDVLTIQHKNLLNCKVQIVDLQGQLLLEEIPNSSIMTIEVQDWKEGLYIVRVITEEGEVVNSKIEVKH
jgi:hypothetical protein